MILFMDCKIEIDIENSTSFVTAYGKIYNDYVIGDNYLYVGHNDRKEYILIDNANSIKKRRVELRKDYPECFI